MVALQCSWHLLIFVATACALRYDPSQLAYNINTNQSATSPLNYWGEWQNHTFTPSPLNWRIPFYTLLLDRFVNGNPDNDNADGTQFEHDVTQTQLRHGGDIRGLQDSLDYLQGMGIKALYLGGSPFVNEPWGADGYSPLDFTLLDHHFGTISEWQAAIAEIHRRGMYIILDNTVSTMGDLIGFKGFLNESTPFEPREHNALWKGERRYADFSISNDELAQCDYPRFYGDDGLEVFNLSTYLVGCRDSDFNQYGDVAAFGIYPEWQRQISKFAFVQDRLREWRPDVLAKIERFACMAIAMLDIDGYRIDKGLTITVDAMAHWSSSIRACAKQFGKENFLISGEVVAGNTFGSVYVGRGRTPENYPRNVTEAALLKSTSDSKYFIRDVGLSAFDSVAFHYTVYRFLSRFLGLDGTYGAEGDPPDLSWIDFWQTIILTNDMVNANDGITFDPRHMYGVTNQDVFRWPTIRNGTQKQLLGYYVVALLLPGIPLLVWGEEQAFYVLDSTNTNYVYGRSPMSSAQAWGMHGCYNPEIGNSKYNQWPIEAGLRGCHDDWVNLDHRDPSHPIRNFMKSIHEMRENYPVFQDGFSLQLLSNQTYQIFLPASNFTPTETGIWSIQRAGFLAIQENLTQIAWLVYTNEDHDMDRRFNCTRDGEALLAPFSVGSVVKNTIFPYDEYVLENSSVQMNDSSYQSRGCLSQLHLPAWGFKAFVLKDTYVKPSPVITEFGPGHDHRMLSTPSFPIEIYFSEPMDCEQIASSLQINSTTASNLTPRVDTTSIKCDNVSNPKGAPSSLSGIVNTTWSFGANMIDVSDGIHQISLSNISTRGDRTVTTNSRDHFLLRIGQGDNPMVFPSANYSSNVLFRGAGDSLYVSHKAAGADKFRYSLNFGTTYSDWEDYPSGTNPTSTLAPKLWSGTKLQEWNGEHVILEYWSSLVGSSDHVQSADMGINSRRRNFPHVFLEGIFNQRGFDAGFANQMQMKEDYIWTYNLFYEWPAQVYLSIWGINPDGQPDRTRVYGDIDGDFVLDRIPPYSLINNVINITNPPPSPFLGWRLGLNDSDYQFQLTGVGSRWNQLTLYVLFGFVPVMTGAAAVWAFMKSFYGVKINELGITPKKSLDRRITRRAFKRNKLLKSSEQGYKPQQEHRPPHWVPEPPDVEVAPAFKQMRQLSMIASPEVAVPKRLTVLIATMEYDIEDWGIKVKIGGLGVMSSLMGKNLKHQDLIWVVPCIANTKYPTDRPAESIAIRILGGMYEIKTQYHVVDNITYVLLDAPIFRQQTKADPYPPRMDDLESAVFYSAWNSCIAEVMRRFPIDLYHINDYHGAVAPLHLLPRIVPCLLSLHNAEFQGLWPMRSAPESQEVCEIYNLDAAVVQKYVRFGDVFNLLHAGASYLRNHQKGFGAVGVSEKYGKRAFARYPIFWGMRDVGGLPNPDPTDTASWSGEQVNPEEISVDEELEASKAKLKRQAQNWAGLKQDPDAELFVFVGRWSNQKGVDAIADVFPGMIERHSNVQIICVGPVIDLYGKFAALKLARMMEIYKGRVFSQPEFTALPPYVFSGADFALMPSRDEPFGLVAVEFGRKGVLCVGARVGGLGNMPGWWFTIESTTTRHFIQQFKTAIEDALRAKPAVRAIMRARATKQRFPVSQWVEDLEKLQSSAIDLSHKQAAKEKRPTLETPSTPAILETPGILDVLQSRFRKPSLRRPRQRPAHPPPAQASKQAEGLMPIAESNSLAGPGPGLGSKMGPSSKRKRPPPPIMNQSSNAVPKVADFALGADQAVQNQTKSTLRPSMIRSPTAPSAVTRQYQQEVARPANRPTVQRQLTMPIPELRPQDRKAVKLLGMQLPANRMNTLMVSEHQPVSSDDSSSPFSSASNTPSTPGTPVSPISAVSGEFPAKSSPTANTRSPRNRTSLTVPSISAANASTQNSSNRTSLNGTSAYTANAPSQNSSNRTSLTAATSVSVATTNAPNSSNHKPRTAPIIAVAKPILHTPRAVDQFPSLGGHYFPHGSISVLSTSEIQEEKPDNMLQKVTPFFSDPKREYENLYQQKLKKLNGKNSENELCIEEYLLKSEKLWFGKLRAAELSKPPEEKLPEEPSTAMVQEIKKKTKEDGFGLGDNYKPPPGLQRFMRRKIGDWPVYSFLLALGQIIAANSYQITLLSGTIGESANKLYGIASIYLATSCLWWLLYRRLPTVYVVSPPFLFYGLAFFLIGLSPLTEGLRGGEWMHNVATAMYALASSSGALFFAVNFADEGGAPVTTFVYRACVIQGTQQLYVVALWYWGAALAKAQGTSSVVANLNSYPQIIIPLGICIACMMWGVGVVLLMGLPQYYRQAPGHIPSFYSSLFRRKIIIWFFVVVVIQNYWLSAPYGRNWIYLWSNQSVPAWGIFLLVLAFFVGVWIVFLLIFNHLSKSHSWILPVFAMGLGAPRWAQILWSTSNMGQYLPWAAGPIASALAGRALWLWLGVLDAVQGVGFGMILLQTLTRFHVLFILIAAQVLGSAATMIARATAPDRLGPGSVFPNLCVDPLEGLSQAWFWVALLSQLAVPVGFAVFYRKEQLSKA